MDDKQREEMNSKLDVLFEQIEKLGDAEQQRAAWALSLWKSARTCEFLGLGPMEARSEYKAAYRQLREGDQGQRYEVTFFDPEANDRRVFGWADDIKEAQRMAGCVEKHPSWGYPWITDRKACTPSDKEDEFWGPDGMGTVLSDLGVI